MANLDKVRRLGPSIRPALIAVAYLLPIMLILHATLFWRHGIIDSETMEFVLNYLQKRPFFAQIFDPQINDWGAYQARELSYAFDWIDTRVFALLLDRHFLVFVPLSGVLGLVAFGVVYLWGARRVFRLDRITSCMFLSWFLSCIVVQASTSIFYRSSKIILSVALLTFLFFLFCLLKTDKRNVTLSKSAALFCIALITALCDRQGFYYLISATIVVLLLWLSAKMRKESVQRAYLRSTIASVGAIIATIFYNRFFTPWLVHMLNGYWPNFAYQNLPLSKLIDPSLPAKVLHVFCDQVSFFFGNLPCLVIALVVAAMLLVTFWSRRSAINIGTLTIAMICLIVIVAVTGLLAAMIARHPAVYEVRDHEFWYYTLTVHVVILFGISAWGSFVEPDSRMKFKPAVYSVVAILIALNIRAYGDQREIMVHSTGWFSGQYAHSQALLEQFRNDPPSREKLVSRSSDLFLDDQAHFLENVELSYLHLIGAVQTEPAPRH